MLAANVCASDFLRKRKQPMLYRMHEGPTPEKLAALREFLKGFGAARCRAATRRTRRTTRSCSTRDEGPARRAALADGDAALAAAGAVYSPDNVGHFGLAYEAYTHFTSPIRRYPDLLVHRAIKAVLERQALQAGRLAALGAHCSHDRAARRRGDARRGELAEVRTTCATTSARRSWAVSARVTAFGVFVALDELYVEGLVHISELGNDYFHFEAAKHQLMGERTGSATGSAIACA